MPPTLRFRVTSETIAIELDGVGVVFEEEALVALMFDARTASPVPLAVGRQAQNIESSLPDLEIGDVRHRRACLVPMEQARWYEDDRGVGARLAREVGDPWEHHGEVVLVRPFGPEGGSLRVWGWVFATIWARLSAEGYPSRLGVLGRAWLRARARVDIELPAWPTDARDHDQLLRTLWQVFGGRVLIGGAPGKLRGRARSTTDLALIAGISALPFTAVLVRAWRGLPWLDRPVLLMATLFFTLAIFMARFTRRRAPDASAGSGDSSPRSLRSAVAVETAASPSAYEGVEHVALGLTARGPAVLLAVLTIVPLVVLAGASVVKSRPENQYGLWGVMLLGVLFGGVLGYYLVRARLSLGERGLTLRLLGVWSPPLRVPYNRVLRVAIINEPGARTLTLAFKEGYQVSMGVGLHRRAGLQRVLRLEAMIQEHLSRPASFRDRGGSREVRSPTDG